MTAWADSPMTWANPTATQAIQDLVLKSAILAEESGMDPDRYLDLVAETLKPIIGPEEGG